MDVTRILVANDPTSYRQAIAAALRELRPNVEVIETEDGDLNREVSRSRPGLVLCSRVTEPVKDLVPNWIELYPDQSSRSVVSIAGELSSFDDITLSDLLSFVDQTEEPVR
ncbi:MAG TPA: hypothetical protein VFE21_01070 [Rubrobacteraceae bacterium]|nr:hypothetical protein [Rubrobacteraceae bacterium]